MQSSVFYECATTGKVAETERSQSCALDQFEAVRDNQTC